MKLLAALLSCLAFDAAAVGTRAEVTILDRGTGRTLPVYWHEGNAYVVGRPGNEYQVTVRNSIGSDLLAVVSVDGLNVMDGRSADPSQAGYVLGAWGSMAIRGWRKSMQETAAFYFTSLGDSYAGRTGRPDDVGVIGVALFERARREPVAMERSRAEDSANVQSKRIASSAVPAPAAAPSAPLATGHGRREDSPTRWVEFERATREPVEVIAIRYDSYANLVAQGVIPAYGQRREPRPFPHAFTPDP